jgi:hypothetical protein
MKKIAGFLAVWFVFVAMYWLYFLRRAPESLSEWLFLLLAGPPAFILISLVAEGLGEAYKRLPGVRHLHAFAERRTVGQETSGLRILVYLITTLIAVAVVIFATWLWRLL